MKQSLFFLVIVLVLVSGCMKGVKNLEYHMAIQDKAKPEAADSLINAYKGIYDASPDSPEAEFLYIRTLSTEQALEKINSFLSKHEDFEPAYVLKAELLIKLGKYDDALEATRKAQMQNEMDWRSYYFKAVAHDSLNQFLESEQSFSEALMKVSQDDDFHANQIINSTKRMKARKLVVIKEQQRKLAIRKDKAEKIIIERNSMFNPVGTWKGMSKLGGITLVIQNDAYYTLSYDDGSMHIRGNWEQTDRDRIKLSHGSGVLKRNTMTLNYGKEFIKMKRSS